MKIPNEKNSNSKGSSEMGLRVLGLLEEKE